MPSMTVPSAAMRRLRRQQQDIIRMRATGGVAKKPSSPAPLCRQESPTRRTDALAPLAASSPSHATAASSPLHATAASSPRHATPLAQPISDSKVISLRSGSQVKVRTATRTYTNWRRLLFWLPAVVVEALEEEDDGCVDVVYSDYEHPARDALGVVRVLKKDVKHLVHVPVPAADSSSYSPASSSPSQGKGLRPAVSGKKPSFL
jgi:hypothetical protein